MKHPQKHVAFKHLQGNLGLVEFTQGALPFVQS